METATVDDLAVLGDVGDVLVAVDGIDLDGGEALPNALEAHGAGPVRLKIVRGGAAREVAVHVAAEAAAVSLAEPRAA
jgi:S1-C subfamily serine protease